MKEGQKIVIQGGKALRGSVRAQGAKNAALPILASALLLSEGTLQLERVPDLEDTRTMVQILQHLGAEAQFENGAVRVRTPAEIAWETPPQLVRRMRASSLVLGPLLARCGRASLPLPGGCSIGGRPIDFHLKGLAKMGAEIELVHGTVQARAKGLRGCRLYMDFPSVGATENLMMAAVCARGETVIENAAREPEITNLAQALRSMGAIISGEGTGTIHVKGDTALHGATVRTIADRIEACTYLLAGIITGGEVVVEDVAPEHLEAFFAKLEEAGAEAWASGGDARARRSARLSSLSLKALPYPGFPTDLQPQMMAVLALADGTSIVQDGVFESRFLHVNELQKMGARIDVQGGTAVITGVPHLRGADVRATDLRAGAALILAGLAASEETAVFQIQHINRGYENIVTKLRSLGAAINLDSSEEEDLA